jgi:PhnB protein
MPTPRPSSRITPMLSVRRAALALDFYRDAFGAVERYRLVEPGSSRVGHAEIEIEGALVMLADEFPEMGIVGPESLGGAGVTLHLEVADVDAFVARAVAAGARLEREVQDEFYGERAGTLVDPHGHRWLVSTPLEPVSPEEMQRRWNAMAGSEG